MPNLALKRGDVVQQIRTPYILRDAEAPPPFPDPPTEGQLYPVGDGRDYLEGDE